MATRTAIIIPTYKRKQSCLQLLQSLQAEVTKNDIVIIVEQGEHNGEAFLQVSKKLKINCTYIYEESLGTARAKNKGVLQSHADYVVFFDDDVVVHKGCVQALVQSLADTSVGVVGGRVLWPDKRQELHEKEVGHISMIGTFSDGFSSGIRQEADTVIGCNMALRRKVFTDTQGFDTNFIGAFREESDLCLRVKKAGYRVVFDPQAQVTHMRDPQGGARKTEGRFRWYYMFFHNETYFFLKHRPKLLLPVFLCTRISYILRCMFGFGREVSMRSLMTPWKGICGGIQKYRTHKL